MQIAVIGGGVAGLSATWALNEHSNHEVHLYEANDYVGGHTNTVLFRKPGEESKSVMVDTGFIVFNELTYPNFLAFIRHLGLNIIASDMSFAVSRTAPLPQPKTQSPLSANGAFPALPRAEDGKSFSPSPLERGAFEWAGATPASLFCQWSNIFSPGHWRMVWDIVRFNHQSVSWLQHFDEADKEDVRTSRLARQCIGEWMAERGYSEAFMRNYLVPMSACIWSTPADRTVSEFPALTLLRFMHNHHLLQILDRPQWLTLEGGWKRYVDRVLAKLPKQNLHKGRSAGRIVEAWYEQSKSRWLLRTTDGRVQEYDRVVFAAHADTTTRILSGELDKDEESRALQSCLGSFEFNKNTALLHTDEKFMPVRLSAWSAWNFMAQSADGKRDENGVVLTYWMNLLQSFDINTYGPILVTLNAPENATAPHKTLARYSYEHPVYTARSVAAQQELLQWQGRWHGAHFAGAWTKYGFHEDGFTSGLRAAYALGATPPFEIRDAERTISVRRTFRLATSTVNALESVRASIASTVLFFAAPFVVLISLVLEFIANALVYAISGKGVRCEVRNELRRIRVAWEPHLHAISLAALSQGSAAHGTNGKVKKH